MNLSLCPVGSAVVVRSLDLDPGERTRLAELGIREDAVVHVIRCAAFGGRVIAVGADRFAIDGRTCACIDVTPMTDVSPLVGVAPVVSTEEISLATASVS